jgi:hypothetical protein
MPTHADRQTLLTPQGHPRQPGERRDKDVTDDE